MWNMAVTCKICCILYSPWILLHFYDELYGRQILTEIICNITRNGIDWMIVVAKKAHCIGDNSRWNDASIFKFSSMICDLIYTVSSYLIYTVSSTGRFALLCCVFLCFASLCNIVIRYEIFNSAMLCYAM